jgi:peptide/nickel transport system substrate-binding protein
MPRSVYFSKLDKLDTSMYMLGWGGSVTDAETTLTPIYRTRGKGGIGDFNYGQVADPKLDQLCADSSHEADPKKREGLVKAAIKLQEDQVYTIPLHRQFIPWATRTNIEVVHRADNWLEWAWVKIK